MNFQLIFPFLRGKNDVLPEAVYAGDFYVAFGASSTSDFCHCQVASSFKHV